MSSAIPGVRPVAGYNLMLDGFLNNIAYELCAVLCFVRARKDTTLQRIAGVLGIGLALYGLGNIYWTLFVRGLDPEPWPSPADALWLSFYPFAFIALLLVVRDMSDRLPLSLWLDGIVGGLAVGAIAAALLGPGARHHRRQQHRHRRDDAGLPAARRPAPARHHRGSGAVPLEAAVRTLVHGRRPDPLLDRRRDLPLRSDQWTGTSPAGINDGVWVLATSPIGFAPGWPKRPVGIALPCVGPARHPGYRHARGTGPAGLRPPERPAHLRAVPGSSDRRVRTRSTRSSRTARPTRLHTAASSRSPTS